MFYRWCGIRKKMHCFTRIVRVSFYVYFFNFSIWKNHLNWKVDRQSNYLFLEFFFQPLGKIFVKCWINICLNFRFRSVSWNSHYILKEMSKQFKLQFEQYPVIWQWIRYAVMCFSKFRADNTRNWKDLWELS